MGKRLDGGELPLVAACVMIRVLLLVDIDVELMHKAIVLVQPCSSPTQEHELLLHGDVHQRCLGVCVDRVGSLDAVVVDIDVELMHRAIVLVQGVEVVDQRAGHKVVLHVGELGDGVLIVVLWERC